ncbi:DUF6415 family natural product biosynthesis protein [Streptomyces odonnellii]|uniref:DUF6415 family natural product biosynthesis protein n=1 Tax=Streptomyces odonnellii TaxID=1417980 RepID=UPI0006266167|nr:DUF6415 family natural product biosynthesis protein [Streptomyces odonnellii]
MRESGTTTAEDIRITIERAHRIGNEPSKREDLSTVLADLRGHIGLLLPAAQAYADQVWRGSQEWYTLATRLHRIGNEAEESLCAGALAAHVQVRQHTVDCEWLLERFGATLAEAESAR